MIRPADKLDAGASVSAATCLETAAPSDPCRSLPRSLNASLSSCWSTTKPKMLIAAVTAGNNAIVNQNAAPAEAKLARVSPWVRITSRINFTAAATLGRSINQCSQRRKMSLARATSRDFRAVKDVVNRDIRIASSNPPTDGTAKSARASLCQCEGRDSTDPNRCGEHCRRQVNHRGDSHCLHRLNRCWPSRCH